MHLNTIVFVLYTASECMYMVASIYKQCLNHMHTVALTPTLTCYILHEWPGYCLLIYNIHILYTGLYIAASLYYDYTFILKRLYDVAAFSNAYYVLLHSYFISMRLRNVSL